jgi:hypothetical protein
MLQRSIHLRSAALLCWTIGSLTGMAPAQAGHQSAPMANMANSHMPGHMYMTTLRPLQPGDQ